MCIRDRVWIIEWSSLPSGYGLAVARGARSKALKMRQYAAGALQGLFTENHSPDGNLLEMRYLRYAGFGAYNRVGALPFYIGGGAYVIPSGFATPPGGSLRYFLTTPFRRARRGLPYII